MLKELRINVQTAMVSQIPAVAIDSNEPAGEIIRNIVQVAAEARTDLEPRARAVYVWRQSGGFKQYAAYQGETLVDHMGVDPGSTGMAIKPMTEFSVGQHPDATLTRESDNGCIAAEAQTRGANVPFALDFMEAFNHNHEERGAIFVLRDWHLYMSESGKDLLDRQLALFETILRGEKRATVVMLSPFGWNTSDPQGCPRLAPEYVQFD